MGGQRSRYLITCVQRSCGRRWYYWADRGNQYCPDCGSHAGTVKAKDGPCKGRRVLVYTGTRTRTEDEVAEAEAERVAQRKQAAKDRAAERKQAKAEALAPHVEHIRSAGGQPTYRFRVPSGTEDGTWYEVDARGCPLPRLRYVQARALCSCPAGMAGSRGCSHVLAVERRWRQEAGADNGTGTAGSNEPVGVKAPADMSRRELEYELRYTDTEGERQTALLAEYGRRVREHGRATG